MSSIANLESQAKSMQQLYLCNNKIGELTCLDYVGQVLLALKELWLSGNDIYSASEEFEKHVKVTIP